jgi:hypothetical protein
MVESVAWASCGNPIPSAPMAGTFEEIPLKDACTDDSGVLYTLTTNASDTAPIFSMPFKSRKVKDDCRWSIATIADGRVTSVAKVAEDLWAITPASSTDGSFWLVVGGRYLHTFASGSNAATYVSPLTKGYSAVAVGAAQDGDITGIERDNPFKGENDLRLVDITQTSSVRIPLVGSSENLIRGSDGNLYFRLFSGWRCHIFEVSKDGDPVDKTACPWQNGQGIAVDSTGHIWQPGLLSIDQLDKSGHITKSVGPIEPFPCMISNTAVLEPRNINADRDGNVWFVHGKLWRYDSRENLSAIALPTGLWVDSMVETIDGTLWIGGTKADHSGAIFHFIPAKTPAAAQ